MRGLLPTTNGAAAAAATTAGYAYFTYFLNATPNTLYVPLTSRCNARTLPMTRGPNFALPSSVVTALCRVRTAEHDHDHYQGHGLQQQQLNDTIMDDIAFPQKLPEYPYELISNIMTTTSTNTTAANNGTATTSSSALTTGRPTVDELLTEIISATTTNISNSPGNEIKSIVIGGEGEPLLRYNTLLSLIQQIKQHFNNNGINDKSTATMSRIPKIRLTTNGLVDPVHAITCTRELYNAGLDTVSVALMTYDAYQYQELMQPLDIPLLQLQQQQQQQQQQGMVDETKTTTTTTTTKIPRPYLNWVCYFCRAAILAGLKVELTAVDHRGPNIIVNKTATEKLAAQLLLRSSDNDTNTTSPKHSPPPIPLVRWRPYFP